MAHWGRWASKVQSWWEKHVPFFFVQAQACVETPGTTKTNVNSKRRPCQCYSGSDLGIPAGNVHPVHSEAGDRGPFLVTTTNKDKQSEAAKGSSHQHLPV